MKVTIIIISLLFTNHFLAIGNKIHGVVINSDSIKIEYFTASLLNVNDSSLIKGGAFLNGHFEFDNITQKNCLLHISCVGYQPVTRFVKFSNSSILNIGTVQLKSLELNEVSITAKRTIFKQNEGRLVVNVKGTNLSKAGDLFDVFKRSPGLIVDNENKLTVFGKGKPLVYIDEREIKNNSELESLQSDQIISIEIDRNPSAEYSASGMSVVRIRTKKLTAEKINLQIFNRNYVARKFSTTSGINVNSKIKNTRATVNYSYSYQKARNYEKAEEINKQSSYTITNQNQSVRLPKTKKHNLFVSLNQELSPNSNIGFQYSFIANNKKQHSKSEQTIKKTGENNTQRRVFKSESAESDLSTYNLNYSYNIDSISSLSIIGDITRSDNQSSVQIEEKNIATNANLLSLIDNKNVYDIYSGKVDFKTILFNSISLQSGVKQSKVVNDGNVSSNNLNTSKQNFKTQDKINDRITSTYFIAKPKLKNVILIAGLRFEHTHRDITSNDKSLLDSTYGNWFPSVMVNKEFCDRLDVTLSYAKKIDRPTFNELSTDITYFDSLSYSVGNPEIRPTISHNLDLTFGLQNNITINFSYSYEKSARIMGAVNDEKNPDIVKYTPVNINKAEYIYSNIDYNYSGKWLSSTFSLGGKKPFLKIPYLNGFRNIRKLSWYFQCNHDLTLSKRLSVFANFNYHSSSKDLMTHFDRRYKLSLGMNSSFFNKKLRVSIMANDIFNSSDNSWEDKFGNIVANSDPDYDNSWVRFSVKYRFNNFKGGLRRKSASDGEIDRL